MTGPCSAGVRARQKVFEHGRRAHARARARARARAQVAHARSASSGWVPATPSPSPTNKARPMAGPRVLLGLKKRGFGEGKWYIAALAGVLAACCMLPHGTRLHAPTTRPKCTGMASVARLRRGRPSWTQRCVVWTTPAFADFGRMRADVRWHAQRSARRPEWPSAAVLLACPLDRTRPRAHTQRAQPEPPRGVAFRVRGRPHAARSTRVHRRCAGGPTAGRVR